MTNFTCEFCGSANVSVASYSDEIEFKGLRLHLENLEEGHCLDCDYKFETLEMHDRNLLKVRAEFTAERASLKKKQNLLSGEEIRAIRNSLGLTQKDAALVFGGGANAFSKYENEEVIQSAAMDKLIRFASYQGQFAVEILRKIYSLTPISNQTVVINLSAGVSGQRGQAIAKRIIFVQSGKGSSAELLSAEKPTVLRGGSLPENYTVHTKSVAFAYSPGSRKDPQQINFESIH